MYAWEMVNYLELSWKQILRDKEVEPQIKTILGVCRWQSYEVRKEALQKLINTHVGEELFIQHCERILEVKIKRQRSLELWR